MSMVLFVAIHTLLKTQKERRDIGGASLLVIFERMGCNLHGRHDLSALDRHWLRLDASWALAVDLLARYDIPYVWDTSLKRLFVGSLDVAPTYRADAIQADVGWELFEMSLQTGKAPVILTGVMRPSNDRPVQTARAWCKVVEFAEEFGISIAYTPLVLGERRGG
jgi:hypothetical protein